MLLELLQVGHLLSTGLASELLVAIYRSCHWLSCRLLENHCIVRFPALLKSGCQGQAQRGWVFPKLLPLGVAASAIL